MSTNLPIVIIKFIDGEKLLISDVSEYGVTCDNTMCFINRLGGKSFFNREQVKYIGRVIDIGSG